MTSLHGKFDEMVDAVLGIPPKPKVPTVEVETWQVPIGDIYANPSLRLDASHYDRMAVNAIKRLEDSGYKLKPLSALAQLVLPSQFTRIWAQDADNGLPYLKGTIYNTSRAAYQHAK